MKKIHIRYGLCVLGMMVLLVWVGALFAEPAKFRPGETYCSIFINGPTTGQKVQAGSGLNISWNTTTESGNIPIAQIIVEIWKGNDKVTSLTGPNNKIGSTVWRVPNSQQPHTNYQAKIKVALGGDYSSQSCSADSPPFEITPPPPPPVKPGPGGVIKQQQTNPNTYKLK